MISTWLKQISREEFLASHFQKAPWAEPGSARNAVPLLTWDKVASLISAHPHPDMIISRKGHFLSGVEPASIDQAQSLFASGCSIVMRNIERFDEELSGLSKLFAEELEGEVALHSFATPIGEVGFGWHYDCEDVFIVQTAGSKEYHLRRNTVNPEPVRSAMPRDMQYRSETSPTINCTLVAGDWLYIPRGWWHTAKGLDDCLSISVGVLSPAAAR